MKVKKIIVEFEIYTKTSEAVLETKIVDLIKYELEGEKIEVKIFNK